MNRPSRTDDDLEHPTWNQNPPFLAADLTTRQDLNGIANAREQRNRRCNALPADAYGFNKNGKHMGHVGMREIEPGARWRSFLAMSGWSIQPLIAPKTVLGGEGQACRFSFQIRPPSGWFGWITSVLLTSALVNVVGAYFPTLFKLSAGAVKPAILSPDKVGSPVRLLSKRQDACAGATAAPHEYNTPLHVGALFIIMGVSSLACGVPLMALKFPFLRIPETFFFGVRHFGTGVLLATAFVHLLPTAFSSLGNPCLSSFWTTDYPAMPGAIALVGIFFVSVIEMVFSPARNYIPRFGQTEEKPKEPEKTVTSLNALTQVGTSTDPAVRGALSGIGGHCGHTAGVVAAITRPSGAHRHSIEPATPLQRAPSVEKTVPMVHGQLESQDAGPLTPEQQHKKSILQCMLLEVGILFHSVFIGMALSVAVGSNFAVLLIAIAFHQTFEGLALGARIASITWPKKTLQPWLMVLAYGCTTPIGQAIGLATHTLYSPDSEFGLILVGTMNAISSGLLVFAALIELLAEDFLSDASWAILRGRRRVFACLLVFLGAVCMSLVGAWA